MTCVKCERLRITLTSLYIVFIHEKSLAIYRIADHTSIGNIQRMMRTNPIRYNTYEKTTHKERKEKFKHIRQKEKDQTYTPGKAKAANDISTPLIL